MGKYIRKFSKSREAYFQGKHRFEHWYADNQIYFITARCKDRTPAFATEAAKAIFWERFLHYAEAAAFTPWIVSLLSNHYHISGYNRYAEAFPKMMQRFHGSVAKLVNDTLETRLAPFWWASGARTYFDGCIRDETQCRRAYYYTRRQSVRHHVAAHWKDYPHTRIWVELEAGVRRAHELDAFLENVPYKRYQRRRDE